MNPAEDNPAIDRSEPLKCDLAREVLRSFGQLRFAATGWSMLPSVLPGDTLVVERIDSDAHAHEVSVGDVVLVSREGRLRAHRVVAFSRDASNAQCITQGDSLVSPDDPVAVGQLLGRVVSLIRGGKMLAVPAELSVIDKLIARIVSRSTPAARAFVYLNRVRLGRRQPVSPVETTP